MLRQLRQSLPDQHGDPPLLLTSQQTIQLNPAGALTLDVAQFAELLAACARCNHGTLGDCPGCVERYSRAAALYRGPFLAGFDLHDSDIFNEWAVIQREHLHRQVIEICFTLASHYETVAHYDLARHYAHRQIELEPWREEAHRQLMRVLALSGQRAAALAQYARCRAILADELGVDPDAETLALYEALRTGKLGAAPRSRAAATPASVPATESAEVASGPSAPAAAAAPTTSTAGGYLHYLARGS